MDKFADIVENTRNLNLAQEREIRDGSRERQIPSSPVPSRCSSKLKLIIERQLSLNQSQTEEGGSGRSSLAGSCYIFCSKVCQNFITRFTKYYSFLLFKFEISKFMVIVVIFKIFS